MCWDYSGNQYFTSSKDKLGTASLQESSQDRYAHNPNPRHFFPSQAIRFVDARSSTVAKTIANSHDGSKSIKLVHLGEQLNKLVSVGFNKASQRQLKIWDPRNTQQEAAKVT